MTRALGTLERHRAFSPTPMNYDGGAPVTCLTEGGRPPPRWYESNWSRVPSTWRRALKALAKLTASCDGHGGFETRKMWWWGWKAGLDLGEELAHQGSSLMWRRTAGVEDGG